MAGSSRSKMIVANIHNICHSHGHIPGIAARPVLSAFKAVSTLSAFWYSNALLATSTSLAASPAFVSESSCLSCVSHICGVCLYKQRPTRSCTQQQEQPEHMILAAPEALRRNCQLQCSSRFVASGIGRKWYSVLQWRIIIICRDTFI